MRQLIRGLKRQHRVSALISLVFASFLLAFSLSLSATAAPAGNPNPINWDIYGTIIGKNGEDLPLRYGQHDFDENNQGFGVYHIQDGHGGYIPDPGVIEQAAETCDSNSNPNVATTCFIKDADGRDFVAVWTERVDPGCPDHRPVGIITAYYL